VQNLKSEDHYGTIRWPAVWLTVPRETWDEACRIYEDEEEELFQDEDAKVNWELDFPYETDWPRARFELDNGLIRFTLEPKQFLLSINIEEGTFSGTRDLQDAEIRENFAKLTQWLTAAIRCELASLVDGPEAYHQRIESTLPNRERFGKLKREDFWRATDSEKHFLRDQLSEDEVRVFSKIASQLAETRFLPEVTVNDYLRYCEICYDGAGYELSGMTPREKYLARADGRHGGLLDIDPGSTSAFARWLGDRSFGAHPWEIVRGGSTTLISLSVQEEEHGYVLSLGGSAVSRATETIRMALALHRHDVPVVLYDANHLARMACGEDWIGVLPHYFGIAPRYCEDFFPEEDQIYDFISYFTIADNPGLERFVQWYPLERTEIAK
jgi:hypothetical protein